MSVAKGGGCGWVLVRSGLRFPVPQFDLRLITLDDIAHALGHQCRFAGHCLRFLSVAEHCVHLYHYAQERDIKRAALFHDAAEYIIQDVVRSVKAELPEYRPLEEALSRKIAEKFEVVYPWPAEVLEYDNRILLDERAQNMPRYMIEGQDYILDGDDVIWRARAFNDRFKPAGYSWVPEEEDGWPFHLAPLGIKLQFWDPETAARKWLECAYAP